MVLADGTGVVLRVGFEVCCLGDVAEDGEGAWWRDELAASPFDVFEAGVDADQP